MQSTRPPMPALKHLFSSLFRSFITGMIFIMAALGIGMLGYHHFETMSWIDAFVNASMILSGMGPLGTLQTSGGKLFAGCYALFSGLTFIFIMGVIFAPLVYRFLHRFHIEVNQKNHS